MSELFRELANKDDSFFSFDLEIFAESGGEG